MGAGPTGSMLAAGLRLAGVRPLVLERRPEHRDIPKANGLGGQILQLLRRPELDEIARDWRHRIDLQTAETDDRPADALLIRPDADIAWAATIDEPTDTAARTLREAFSCWFGAPARSDGAGVVVAPAASPIVGRCF
ncbi:aromatic-ring hydroxylase C-terminal domain-containing protein [Nocardia xishanensis]